MNDLKHTKGKRMLAMLLAILLCSLPLHIGCGWAEESAPVQESTPKQESAPKQESPKQEEAPKQEIPKQETPEQPPSKPEENSSTPQPSKTEPPTSSSNDDVVCATQEPIEQPTATPEISPTPEITPDATMPPESPSAEATLAPDAEIDPIPSDTPEPTATPEAENVPDFEMWGRSKEWSDLHLNAEGLRIPSDGMPIPLLYQYDYKKTVCYVEGDSKSVSSSGCGAASASMLIAYIRRNYDQTPYTLFYWAADNGWYRGDGLDYDGIRRMLSNHGVDSRMLEVSSERIVAMLKENRPIIIKMGAGTFTDGGHYIVLRGLDAEGKVLVNDPNSSARSQNSYSASLIARECKSAHMLVAYTRPEGIVQTDSADTEAPYEVETENESADQMAQPTEKPTEQPVAQAIETEVSATEDGIFDGAYCARVQYASVNLRESPSDGLIVTSVKEGTLLCVTDEVMVDGRVWCAVNYQGAVLYIRGDMIAVEDVEITVEELPAEPPDAQMDVVTEENTVVETSDADPIDTVDSLDSSDFSEMLSETEDGIFEGVYLAAVAYKRVNLRDLPGTDYTKSSILTSVSEGTVLCVLGEEVDTDGRVWCVVSYQRQKLYIRGDMLRKIN